MIINLNQISGTNELLALALSNDKRKEKTVEIKAEKTETDFDFSKITSPGFLYLAAEANSKN